MRASCLSRCQPETEFMPLLSVLGRNGCLPAVGRVVGPTGERQGMAPRDQRKVGGGPQMSQRKTQNAGLI